MSNFRNGISYDGSETERFKDSVRTVGNYGPDPLLDRHIRMSPRQIMLAAVSPAEKAILGKAVSRVIQADSTARVELLAMRERQRVSDLVRLLTDEFGPIAI